MCFLQLEILTIKSQAEENEAGCLNTFLYLYEFLMFNYTVETAEKIENSITKLSHKDKVAKPPS